MQNIKGLLIGYIYLKNSGMKKNHLKFYHLSRNSMVVLFDISLILLRDLRCQN